MSAAPVNLPPVPIGAAWNGPKTKPPKGNLELLLRNGLSSRGTFDGKTMCITNYMGTPNLRVAASMLTSFIDGWRV